MAQRWGYIDDRIHSELDAIIKASRRDNIKLSDCTLWNVRINRWNKVCLSRPCARCSRLIKSVGIKKIYYTNDLGEYESD
jgi:deoxycytidylate deaminase